MSAFHLLVDEETTMVSKIAAQDAPAYRGSHFGGTYPFATYELEVGFRF